MKLNNRLYLIIFLGLIFLGGVSCVKSNDGLVVDGSSNRPFLPYSFNIKTTRDSAVFSWSAPVLSAGKRYDYTVDVSTDSTFGTIDFTKTVNTLGFVVVDPELSVGKKYYARLQVNSYEGSNPSRIDTATRSFTIPGLNYFKLIREKDISSKSALVHWIVNDSTRKLDKLVLTLDSPSVVVNTYDLSGGDVTGGQKLLDQLMPETKYNLQAFANGKSYGIIKFSTPKELVFTTVLSAGADLAAALESASNGDVIGLSPGVYDGSKGLSLRQKHLTLASTSNNPYDTKLLVKELDLYGDSSGISLKGIDIDGHYNDGSYGVQFIMLKGLNADGEAAQFSDVKMDNCLIHDFTRCFLIGNKAANANDHKIGTFSINNSIIYNIDSVGTSTYYTFSMENLELKNFKISNSTFYNMGVGFINMSKTLQPTLDVPTISIDACTFNNFGGGNKNLLFDANNNKIFYTLRNSILANTPQAGSINGTAFRCTGSGSTLDFLNNNYFNLYTSAGGTSPLSLTGLNEVSCLTIDLGWTAATRNFSLASYPEESEFMTMSTSAHSVGDPRWAY